MEITLYKTKSPINSINKVLEEGKNYSVKLKDYNSISNPSLVLTLSEDISTFNYCYIPSFNRYYFISNVTVRRNNIVELDLTCDVLESFKADILTSTGLITQSTSINNYYNADYDVEIKKESEKFYGSISHDLNANTKVLVTIGGV